MSQEEPHSKGLEDLKEALNSQTRAVNIRLREGEYQFGLAKAIASFEIDLRFPDVKDLVKRMYGDKRTEDQRFLNMIQTILKKMEKSGVVRILPKEKPWELQKYALLSFKFVDVEKNTVVLATEDEITKAKKLIYSQPVSEVATSQKSKSMLLPLVLLISLILSPLALIIWMLTESRVNLTIFVSAFCLAALSSTILGILVGRRK